MLGGRGGGVNVFNAERRVVFEEILAGTEIPGGYMQTPLCAPSKCVCGEGGLLREQFY